LYDYASRSENPAPLEADEAGEYYDIDTNLVFPGRVITFLQKYRGQLVTLANGFDLE
jgi:hypothetical protein